MKTLAQVTNSYKLKMFLELIPKIYMQRKRTDSNVTYFQHFKKNLDRDLKDKPFDILIGLVIVIVITILSFFALSYFNLPVPDAQGRIIIAIVLLVLGFPLFFLIWKRYGVILPP